MEEGSKIQNMDGRGVYADGGKVEIGGAISSIAANKSAMWQSNSGIVIHLRNSAEGADRTIWQAACRKNRNPAGVLQEKTACILFLYADNRPGTAS